MRAKLTLLSALVVGTLGGVLATGCQTYDFEPVEPLAISQTTETRRIEARERKPNLMLLVDTSGSMMDPVDKDLKNASNVYLCRKDGTSTGEACGPSFPCDTTRCPTRWTALQEAMKDFLAGSSTIARLGLATYPKDDACGSTSQVSITLPAADKEDEATLVASAQAVNNKLQSIQNSSTTPGVQTPMGGTPTALSLQFLGTRPELQTEERADFVLLLTDGLPNCNEQFPYPAPDSRCFCTLTNGCAFAQDIGCLDKNASVAAVQALRLKAIKTIVIGFGADFKASTTDPAQQEKDPGYQGAKTLNDMADAGGFARACTQDVDCGAGDTCNTTLKLCNRRFYQAANKNELVAALQQIGQKVQVGDPCLLTFDATQRPSSQELVVVYINAERLAPGADTWSLTADGIKFAGTTCERIRSSTPANPVDIEVRAVQKR